MSQFKPSDFSLLLEVFRDGLKYGVISNAEIVEWADEIIKREDEPDYFFIEMSLCSDVNSLATLLNEPRYGARNPIACRVIFGLIYQKLIDKTINAEMVYKFLYGIDYADSLYNMEYVNLYQLDYYDEILFGADPNDFIDEKAQFLSIYKDFNLTNHTQWEEINSRVEDILKNLEAENVKTRAINQAFYKEQEKRRLQQKLLMRVGIHAVAVITFIVIMTRYKLIQNGSPLSKFWKDLYLFSILYFDLFVCYYIIVGIYWGIRKVLFK